MTACAESMTARVVDFAMRPNALDDEVVTRATELAIVAIVSAVHSCAVDDHAVTVVEGLADEFAGPVVATCWRTGAESSPAWAAFANAASAHQGLPIGDSRRLLVPTVSAAVVAGEVTNATTTRVLEACAVALEASLWLQAGLSLGRRESVWDPVGTFGRLGAALASARVLGLDREGMLVAVALAATQASGLAVQVPTASAAFISGHSAAGGIEASMLAEQGFTAPVEPIAGRRGLVALTCIDAQLGDTPAHGRGVLASVLGDWQASTTAWDDRFVTPYLANLLRELTSSKASKGGSVG